MLLNYKIVVLTMRLVHFGEHLRRDLRLDRALRQLIGVVGLLDGVVEDLLRVSALEAAVVVLDVDDVVALQVLSLLLGRLLDGVFGNHLHDRRLRALRLPLVFELVIQFGLLLRAALFREVLEVALTVRVLQLVVILRGGIALDEHAVFLVLLLRLIGRHGWVRVDFAKFLVGGHASVLAHVEIFGVVVLGGALFLELLGE